MVKMLMSFLFALGGILSVHGEVNISTCGPGWREFGTNCYFFNYSSADFGQNTAMCHSLNSTPVCIHSQEENDFVLNHTREVGDPWLGSKIWTSSSGPIQWLDNSALDYVNWAPGEPQCPGIMGSCCAPEMIHTSGKWRMYSCSFRNIQVCRKKRSDTPIKADGPCPLGWHWFENKCFFVDTVVAEFKENEMLCTSMNATMVSLHSQAEQTFLYDLVFNKYMTTLRYPWLGGNQIRVGSKSFQWMDRTPFDYYLWGQNRPNCGPTFNCCLILWKNSTIFDVNCESKHIQVCQKYISMPNDLVGEGTGSDDFNATLTETTTGSGLKCPRGWQLLLEKCYIFNPTKAGFWDTLRNCRKLGAHMAFITSQEENQMVHNFVFVGQKVTGEVWLGAKIVNDYRKPEQWWDMTPLNYTNWGQKQISCSNPYFGCGLEMRADGKWFDFIEYYKNHQLCQIETSLVNQQFLNQTKVEPVETSDGCRRGWRKYQNKCLFVHLLKGSFMDNKVMCSSLNATMVSVHSRAEQNFVLDIAAEAGFGGLWLGGKQVAFGSKSYQWLDKSPFDYSQWATNEPNCYQSSDCCAIELRGPNMFAERCSHKRLQFCQKYITEPNATVDEYNETLFNETVTEAGLTCPRGWYLFKDNCYLFNSTKANIRGNMLFCRNFGAHMVYVTTREENEFVRWLVFGRKAALGEVWLGAEIVYNRSKSRQWRDKSNLTYENWGQEEPNCMHFFTGCGLEVRRNGRWYNFMSTYKNHQLCQMNVSSAKPQVTPEAKASRCHKGWHNFGEKCFLVNKTSARFEENKMFCSSLNSTMVSIHSRDENNFLHNLVYSKHRVGRSNEIWLGGRRRDGVYQWEDGSEFDFNLWEEDQPDCLEKKESLEDCSCIEAHYTKEWHDFLCGFTNVQTCQRPSLRVSTSTATVESATGSVSTAYPEAPVTSSKTGFRPVLVDEAIGKKEASIQENQYNDTMFSIDSRLKVLSYLSHSSRFEPTLLVVILILLIVSLCFIIFSYYRPSPFQFLMQKRQFDSIPLQNME